MKKILTLIYFMSLALACNSAPKFNSDSVVVSHQIWDELLQKHVDEEGQVDYSGFIASKDSLDAYLAILSANPASDTWSNEERLAYWINAYNAFTVLLIVDNYPLESIRDLHPTIYIPAVRTVWHRKFFKIGGKDMNLDTIEHGILRKEFDEPLIHFGIVCASKSCPSLLNEAYDPKKIDEQLKERAIDFLSDESRNRLSKNEIHLSKIFSWFKGDFTKQGSLIDFLNRYSQVEISEDATIKYLKYDWSLND